MMNKWYVWTITANRYNKIKEFLSNLPQLENFVCPLVEKEIKTKDGIKKKNVPLYDNYIFLKHKHTVEMAAAIERCPWIHNCLGTCSQEEVNQVKALDSQRYEDLISSGDLYVGKQIKMAKTAFKDMIAIIVEIDDNRLVVSINLFGAERFIKCSINDVDIGE